MNKTIVVSVIALMTAGCVAEPRVHEVIGPISGHLIRTIEGPTDEGGGVRVSGIQTFSPGGYLQPAAAAGCGPSTTRTVRRKLCDGRVVTRQVRVPGQAPAPVPVQTGWQMHDSQFFAGPGMAQTLGASAIAGGSFIGGMYAGKPPKIGGDNISVVQQGGGATANALGGAGGAAFAGANASAAARASSNASARSLNQASYTFHKNNPPDHHKPPHHDYKPPHHDKPDHDKPKHY